MGLIVSYIEDDKPGLDDLDTLMKALRSAASNGGDSRCLCGGCLAAWALKHLSDYQKTERM